MARKRRISHLMAGELNLTAMIDGKSSVKYVASLKRAGYFFW